MTQSRRSDMSPSIATAGLLVALMSALACGSGSGGQGGSAGGAPGADDGEQLVHSVPVRVLKRLERPTDPYPPQKTGTIALYRSSNVELDVPTQTDAG
jgi:hypothetical protein